MPTFHLLHAAGFDPDAVLPQPPARLRGLFASASLAAVEQLVTRAIELEVDAVVVMPVPAIDGLSRGPSLHAEAALREQFERLADLDVAAFVVVGQHSEGWQRLAGGGSNVVVLSPGDVASVPDHEGRTRATFRCVDALAAPERSLPIASHDAVEIVLAPSLSAASVENPSSLRHRYLALGVGDKATVSLGGGIAHAPGAMQSLGKSCGPHGATLVSIDGAGKPRTEFVSTSVLRFEAITVEAEPTDALDDLALRMTEQLETRRAEPGEQAWLVRWTVEASEPLFTSLNDPLGRNELVSLLPEAIGEVPIVHEVRIVPHSIWPALNDAFAAEFEAALQEQAKSLTDEPFSLLALPDAAPHRRRLAKLVGGGDATAVLGDARRFGLRVISAAHDEEASE
ncbi:MAG: hypothetical protein M3552_11960 [Planctomycetota bacterium]|nr:hypothetical protein [Planctomycetaceae bacterium]MDQ3331349.1 hypothetical protein [Planctomycetota bacterium]